MGRLGVRRPIPGINTPGRVEAIVDGLFPGHAQRTRREWTINGPIVEVTATEVAKLASAIPGNKAPGPDAIPGEAVKILAANCPEWIAAVFNQCH